MKETARGAQTRLFLWIILSSFILNGCNKGGDSSGVLGCDVIDCVPPTVESVSPPNGATNVSPNAQISATFSESMKEATLSTNTFIVNTIGVGGTLTVSGTVTYSDATKTATFIPTAQLSPNTTYSVTITTGVEDLAANKMVENKSWSFTTNNVLDNVAPAFANDDPQLNPQATGSNSISLAWQAATDNTTPPDQIRYEICQSISAADCTTIPFPAAGGNVAQYETDGATVLNVTGLTKSTPYYFVVRAKDLAGNIDANVAQKTATTFGDFASLGGSLNNSTNADAIDPSIAVVGGVPYLTWSEGTVPGKVYVRTFNTTPKTWSSASLISTSGNHAEKPMIVSNGAGSPIPYITYTECFDPGTNQWNSVTPSANICKVYVKNGTTWVPVGNPANSFVLNFDPTKSARDSAIAFDNSNPPVPYVIWGEVNGGGISQIYVKHFDGTSWVSDPAVGPANLNVDPTQDAFKPAIAIDGTAIRIAWSECIHSGNTNDCQLYVKKWDIGVSTTWAQVGGSLKVGTPGPFHPDDPSLAFINHVPYISWHESTKVYVMQEGGGGFTPVGTISKPASPGSNTPIGGTVSATQIPYLVFADDTDAGTNTAPALIVKRWTGADWVTEGSGSLNMATHPNPTSRNQAMNSSIAFSQGTPYVAWMELGDCAVINTCGTFDNTHSQLYVKRLE